jgi:ATP-dependent RNA helicase RhlE
VYSEKDERLLLDIEKLIKQTITRGTLDGFVAPASRGRDAAGARESGRESGRESARPPRDASREFVRDGSRDAAAAPRDAERGPRRDAEAGRGAPRTPRTGPGPGSRRERVDPWFLKPYEPTSSPRKDPDPVNAPAKPGKQKLAFLLGGGPK